MWESDSKELRRVLIRDGQLFSKFLRARDPFILFKEQLTSLKKDFAVKAFKNLLESMDVLFKSTHLAKKSCQELLRNLYLCIS